MAGLCRPGQRKQQTILSVGSGAHGIYTPETLNHDLVVLFAKHQVLAAIYLILYSFKWPLFLPLFTNALW